MTSRLRSLIDEANACTHCAAYLPHGPRPVFRVHRDAKVLLIGQAPGAKVHASGAPWDDHSGDHLREWLGVDRATFDDPKFFAIMPMGFCWPGRRKGGDLPPRPECAPKWHAPIRALLPHVELTLLIGQYAQDHYLSKRGESLTETVRNFEAYLPGELPLPHPSWRSKLWMKKNPWFERKLLPVLRDRVQRLRHQK